MDINDIRAAAVRLQPYITKTRVIPLPSAKQDDTVYLKLENEQVTGSFKARGGLNKILSLNQEQAKNGIITASTGNHGLGVANACKIAGVRGTIYLPESTLQSKKDKLLKMGAELEFFPGNSLETELHARDIAERKGKTWISPYNDPEVIAGQGTIGLELLDQLPELDRVFVTVGGGGLVGGVAFALKTLKPSVRVIGCQPANSPEMSMSVKQGRIVTLDEPKATLSDGSAGGVEEGSITFELCCEFVDQWVLISEWEIACAMHHVYGLTGIRIEGSAGVAVAAALSLQEENTLDAVIICGGNIAPDAFDQITESACK